MNRIIIDEPKITELFGMFFFCVGRYLPPHPASVWPLTANILDPVRLSIVVDGPSRMLEIIKWFDKDHCSGPAEGSLRVLRVKNRFGLPREEVPDGYRDVKLFVHYTSPAGLGIVGEIQASAPKALII